MSCLPKIANAGQINVIMDSSDGKLLHKMARYSNDHLLQIETNKPRNQSTHNTKTTLDHVLNYYADENHCLGPNEEIHTPHPGSPKSKKQEDRDYHRTRARSGVRRPLYQSRKTRERGSRLRPLGAISGLRIRERQNGLPWSVSWETSSTRLPTGRSSTSLSIKENTSLKDEKKRS